MLLCIDKGCFPSVKPLEDGFGYGENFMFVIDGATGLTGKKYTKKSTDAAWFAEFVKKCLMEELKNENISTEELLKKILKDAEKYFMSLSKEINYDDCPSACIIIFREIKDDLEVFQIGDCFGVIEYKNGKKELLEDRRITKLDENAINEMVKIAKEKNISLIEARKEINPILIENRRKRNKKDGYASLDFSALGIDLGIKRVFKKNDIKRIYAMSDGVLELCTPFKIYKGTEELSVALLNNGIENEISKLRKLEENDKELKKYPRFKIGDDATALICEIII